MNDKMYVAFDSRGLKQFFYSSNLKQAKSTAFRRGYQVDTVREYKAKTGTGK